MVSVKYKSKAVLDSIEKTFLGPLSCVDFEVLLPFRLVYSLEIDVFDDLLPRYKDTLVVFTGYLTMGCVDLLGEFTYLFIRNFNLEVLFVPDEKNFGLGGYLLDFFHPELLEFFECVGLVQRVGENNYIGICVIIEVLI